MKYGKIIDGKLILAPSVIEENGRVHYHPSEALYAQKGYLPIEETPYPNHEIEEGETPNDLPTYSSRYEVQGGRIVQIFEVATQTEEPSLPTLEDRVSALESAMIEIGEELANG